MREPEFPKTGDRLNITAQISKDGGASAPLNQTNPAELDATNQPGIYVFDLTQAETNADLGGYHPQKQHGQRGDSALRGLSDLVHRDQGGLPGCRAKHPPGRGGVYGAG